MSDSLPGKRYRLRLYNERLAVCRLPLGSSIPEWAAIGSLSAVIRTPDEISVLCDEAAVPTEIRAERGWRFLRVEAVLDFSLVGVLAELTGCLAAAGISLFALSTFDTDYLLVKEVDLPGALDAFRKNGYPIIEWTPG